MLSTKAKLWRGLNPGRGVISLMSLLYYLKKSQVLYTAMRDWFCQIKLIDPIWRQKKVELRKSSNARKSNEYAMGKSIAGNFSKGSVRRQSNDHEIPHTS